VARPSTARCLRRGAPRAVGIAATVALLVGAAPDRASPPPEAGRPSETEKPATGRFLVATEQVRGSFFQHSVVLLLSYTADGAIGVVVNRRTDIALEELVQGAVGGTGALYLGGPVSRNSVLVLLRAGSPPERAVRIAGDLFLTVDPALLLDHTGDPAAARDLRVYTGYAGWGPGQLDAEIARGDWIVASEGADAVFDDTPDELWKKLHRRHHRVLTRGGGAIRDLAGSTRPAA
jgi:putative transcriptional regulator